MRYLTFLLAILTASPCYAGPAAKRMLAVMGGSTCTPPTSTTNSVGGVTTVSNTGTTDTGTVTVGTAGQCGGTGSVVLSCTGGSSYGNVFVQVNGVNVANAQCGAGASQGPSTRTFSVHGGAYTVRIYGAAASGGTYSATSFSFPVP